MTRTWLMWLSAAAVTGSLVASNDATAATKFRGRKPARAIQQTQYSQYTPNGIPFAQAADPSVPAVDASAVPGSPVPVAEEPEETAPNPDAPPMTPLTEPAPPGSATVPRVLQQPEAGPFVGPSLECPPGSPNCQPAPYTPPTSPTSCDGCDATGGGCDGTGEKEEEECGLINIFSTDLEKPFDLTKAIFGDEAEADIGGWAQAGYTNNSDSVFNTVPDRVNLHQGWLFFDKAFDTSEDDFDWGARVDVVYGIDGENTQSYGNNRGNWDFADSFDHGVYHWAIPQAYGVLAFDKLNVKIGHFYTLHGFEVVGANGNFFYSHSFTFNYSEPFTHTGALATYTVSDDVEVYGGWVAGWDSGFDRLNNASAFHGGAKLKLTDDITFIYAATIGNNGWIGDGHSQSIVLDVALTDKLKYVLSSDYVNTNGTVFANASNDFDTISAANYLLYQATDKVGIGGRAEWFRMVGTTYYEVTGGLNLKPLANLTVRPEIRYQWAPDGTAANAPIALDQETIFGIDATFAF